MINTQRGAVDILTISDLVVVAGEAAVILNSLNLSIQQGQIHALMGPNGSGKSTLAYALMGHPAYTLKKGSIRIADQEIHALSPDKRARLGLFLAFQYPQEIPGVSISTFLKEVYTARMGVACSHSEFKEILEQHASVLGLDNALLSRNLNEGFSGGEKKRLEMLQLVLLNPVIAIIDEIDSGLDVDALKVVARALAFCRKRNPDFAALIITHYQRILHYVRPDRVHILCNGALVESGDCTLALRVEERGYDQYRP